jgi:hypothetical protein
VRQGKADAARRQKHRTESRLYDLPSEPIEPSSSSSAAARLVAGRVGPPWKRVVQVAQSPVVKVAQSSVVKLAQSSVVKVAQSSVVMACADLHCRINRLGSLISMAATDGSVVDHVHAEHTAANGMPGDKCHAARARLVSFHFQERAPLPFPEISRHADATQVRNVASKHATRPIVCTVNCSWRALRFPLLIA